MEILQPLLRTGPRVHRFLEDFWGALAGVIAGAGAWLVRRVITNQRQIELLKSEMRHRDSLRDADRADMSDVKRDVREIRNALLGKST